MKTNTSKHCYGTNIRKWRLVKGIKQCQLAAHLHITEGALSNIENDKSDISLHRFVDIAEYLHIPFENLLVEPG
ncbi:MAG: helix-turn-helix transcriptional regulator [Ferruginibacter sp.]